MAWLNRRKEAVSFEEILSDDWGGREVAEEPIGSRSLFFIVIALILLGFVVLGRIFYLGIIDGEFYRARAEANLSQTYVLPAPRGIIYDVNGEELVSNIPVFMALLDLGEFLRSNENQNDIIAGVSTVIGTEESKIWEKIENDNSSFIRGAVVLSADLSGDQLIKLQSMTLPAISILPGFKRDYKDGEIFSSIVGYTGFADADDLMRFPDLGIRDLVGKTGVESFYNDVLLGQSGKLVKIRDSLGNILEEQEGEEPEIGDDVHLTIDADFQRYFYNRLQDGLRSLGRSSGAGIALDPQSGKVLALISLPSFDSNVFSDPGRSEDRIDLLNSPLKPLFNRVVSGLYSPGSTIKPLDALAALAEGVITPDQKIFSPGFLDIPNPYNPDQPTRYLDWRYQGYVDLSGAIAQSSNVYFYIVGGGLPPGADVKEISGGAQIGGLGIDKLNDWWSKFNLGSPLGIDIPGERGGFLPNEENSERDRGWLLGDTYNVSIGQGDLLVTPLQIVNYISAIANGGKVYEPFISELKKSDIISDFSYLSSSIEEVKKGMEESVSSNLGTAHLLDSLPFRVAGKTGSAQTNNNTRENAFFVGYAPADDPEIAILILVENSKEGSLNTIPIARDVLDWYYSNRIISK